MADRTCLRCGATLPSAPGHPRKWCRRCSELVSERRPEWRQFTGEWRRDDAGRWWPPERVEAGRQYRAPDGSWWRMGTEGPVGQSREW